MAGLASGGASRTRLYRFRRRGICACRFPVVKVADEGAEQVIIAAIVALLIGIVVGAVSGVGGTSALEIGSKVLLYALMLSVGISVGANRQMLAKIRTYDFRILLVPLGAVAGSLAGGAVAALFLRDSLQAGMVVAGGMGWYSLCGIVVTELMGTEMGTVAFLSNILREIVAFCLIPFLVKHLNLYAAIALAGATSEDTSLPVIMRYGGEDTVFVAVLNGVLCSALVPVVLNALAGGS